MRPVIDAHHHLWDPATRDYPWMAGETTRELRRAFTLEDLRRVTADAGVSRTVLVQTVSSVAETQEFLGTADASGGLIAGVVGWVDLQGPDVGDALAALRAGAGGHALVGVRHQVEDEPDPEWLSGRAARRGARAVAQAGLVQDLLVRTDQLDAVDDVLAALPEARFVLDHGAKPPLPDPDAYGRWAAATAAVARHENLVCKVSGLFTLGGDAAARARALQHLLEVFGPRRLVFGTDWPVSTLALSYPDVVAATVDLLADLSVGEREAVLHGTATATYGLPHAVTAG